MTYTRMLDWAAELLWKCYNANTLSHVKDTLSQQFSKTASDVERDVWKRVAQTYGNSAN